MGEVWTITPREDNTELTRVATWMAEQNTKMERFILESVRIQREQAEAIKALEREIRECVPLTAQQEKAVNAAIRDRARELLTDRGCEDRKKHGELARIIRKDVLAHWGCRTVREIPRIDYPVAVEAATRWRDPIRVRTVAMEKAESRKQNDAPEAL